MSDKEPAGRRRAVAMAYGEGDSAPRVVAKGYGELAAKRAFMSTMLRNWWPC